VTIWLIVMIVVYAISRIVARHFFDWATFGSAVLCFQNDRKSVVTITMVAVPLFGLGVLLGIPGLSAALMALGCSGVFLLTYRTIRGSELSRENLRIGVWLPIFVLFSAAANSLVVHFTPHLFDDFLLQTDFGVGARLRAWTTGNAWIWVIVGICYEALPAVVVVAIASTSGKDRSRLLWSVCLAAVLALPCYLLVPAVGPVHAGILNSPRNCMPSLHLTWAALLWINARRGWWRRFFLVFTVVTAFCTLATGEHYVADLVAAIPFTWIVYQLSIFCIDKKQALNHAAKGVI
jgi:hypothetical protein